MIEVVSAVIVRAGRLLLTQRRPTQDYPFAWESPGGKVEGGESHHDALRRELAEEIGVTVGPISENALWCGEIQRGERESAFVLLYPVGIGEQEPTPREGQGIGWFLPGHVRRMDLTPANRLATRCVLEAMERADCARRAMVAMVSGER